MWGLGFVGLIFFIKIYTLWYYNAKTKISLSCSWPEFFFSHIGRYCYVKKRKKPLILLTYAQQKMSHMSRLARKLQHSSIRCSFVRVGRIVFDWQMKHRHANCQSERFTNPQIKGVISFFISSLILMPFWNRMCVLSLVLTINKWPAILLTLYCSVHMHVHHRNYQFHRCFGGSPS